MTNPKIKYACSLKKGTKSGKNDILIEGLHIMESAIAAHREGKCRVRTVFFSQRLFRVNGGNQILRKLSDTSVIADEVSEKMIDKLSEVETPQGIIAIVELVVSELGEMFNSDDPLILILDGIQDPGNLGTIIRAADAFGASGIIMTKNTVSPYNPKAVRSTAGSIFNIRLANVDNMSDIVQALKRRGVRLISTKTDAEMPVAEADLRGPVAIVIGSESQGVGRETLKVSDETVSIPMVGRSESLNAAVSASIILYEALRQRKNNGKQA